MNISTKFLKSSQMLFMNISTKFLKSSQMHLMCLTPKALVTMDVGATEIPTNALLLDLATVQGSKLVEYLAP